MKYLQYYEAKIKKVESIKNEDGYVVNNIVWVTPIHNELGFMSEKKAYPPSVIGSGIGGGGFTSIPTIGQRCIVFRDDRSEYDKILTYVPMTDGFGASGMLKPSKLNEGAFELKSSGAINNSVLVDPTYGVKLTSSSDVTLSLNYQTKSLNISTFSLNTELEGGILKYLYEKENKYTDEENTNEFIFTISRLSEERRIGTDLNLEENTVAKVQNSYYSDKVILKAGNIYRKDSLLELDKNKLNHLWQLETRQSTIGNSKNILTLERRGYQKENYKNGLETKYAAGTIYELVSKKVNALDLDTWLLRYGKLESDTTGSEAETTSGEVYRNQIYSNLVGYTFDALNPLQKGKGWKYSFINKDAGLQFTESVGDFDGSFYKKHLHYYSDFKALNKSTYTGVEYSEVRSTGTLLGANTTEKFTDGTSKLKLSETLNTDGTFKLHLTDDSNNEYEISMGKGVNGIKIKFTGSGKEVEVNLDASGKIVINPGSDGNVYIGAEGSAKKLLTSDWVTDVFDIHIHDTPSGPSIMTKSVKTESAYSTKVLKSN